MVEFSEPSDELAARILGEVGFEERFVGTKMTPMAGNRVFSIYSFEEAVDFLHMDSLEDLLNVERHPSVGYLDLEQLSGKYNKKLKEISFFDYMKHAQEFTSV